VSENTAGAPQAGNDGTTMKTFEIIGTIVGTMSGIFAILEWLVPRGLIAPIVALGVGLAVTIVLIRMRKWTVGMALTIWVVTSVAVILIGGYLLITRPAVVVGSVIQNDGTPVAGAKLTLLDSSGVEHRAVTDEDGEFEYRDIPAGRYTISTGDTLLISGEISSGLVRILGATVPVGQLAYHLEPTPTVLPEPVITISYPATGATVKLQEIVRGTSANIPEGYTLSVMVYPHAAGLYYPQHSMDIGANGDWTSLTTIGKEGNSGEAFDIVVVLADPDAQAVITAYLDTAKAADAYPGLDKLPSGAVEYDRVIVTRE
jgi:hypothetical protein